MKTIHIRLDKEEHKRLKKTKGGTWLGYLRKASWFVARAYSKPTKDFASWKSKKQREKPCLKLGFCPYGQLVEAFPLVRGEFSCRVFGHDCPVFYCAEPLSESPTVKV